MAQSTSAQASQPAEPPESRFLDLPAELRNDIYRHAILKDKKILVTTSGIDEPSLLRACKQIRDEALPIYYAENRFTLQIIDYKSDVVLSFERRERCQILRRHNIECEIRLRRVGTANWQNLREWLERFHARELRICIASGEKPLPPGVCGRDAIKHVIGSMFHLASKTRSLPWEEVDALLEDQHKMLVMLDGLWQ